MLKIIRKKHQIIIEEINNEIFVSDEKVVNGDKKKYKLNNIKLGGNSEFVEKFVDTCLDSGFTYALQHNHPRDNRRGDAGNGLKYISFGREYGSGTEASWDVALDEQSPKTICIAKRHKNILRQEDIPFDQEMGSGQNLRINPEHLNKALVAIAFIYSPEEPVYPDDIVFTDDMYEGVRKSITVNSYERNFAARAKCIEHYKARCSVCKMSFEEVYGEIGKNFIHVHHITPLSKINEEYKVNPIEDLRPVCPNCHSMLHKKNPPYTIEELKEKINGLI